MKIRQEVLALCFVFGSASFASASYLADVSYDYTETGEGDYTFFFNIENNSTDLDDGGLDFFYIDFNADSDYSSYTNLTWDYDNFWYADVLPPVSGLGFDQSGGVWADDIAAYGGSGGLSQGESATFSVSFSYSGILDPSDQLFSWVTEFGTNYDGDGTLTDCGYYILGMDYGVTSFSGTDLPSEPVPEPATMLLFGTGLVGLARLRKRKK